MQQIEDQSGEPRFRGDFMPAPVEAVALEPAPEERAADRRRAVWLRLPMYRPVLTMGILVILGGVFLLQLLSGERITPLFWKDNQGIAEGEYYRLLTATFLHGGWLHLLFNAYGIFLFGQQVESFYGRLRFLSIYFLSGLAGSVASFAFSPADSLGASGALFGLVGALGLYFWVHRRLLGAQGRAQLWNVLFIVGINLVFGLTQSMAIDNWGHIGGLIGGLVAGLALVPHYRPGRELGVDERMLEDRTPTWVPPLATAGLFALLAGLFVLALLAQGATL